MLNVYNSVLLVISFISLTSLANQTVARVRIYVDHAGIQNWFFITGKTQNVEFVQGLENVFNEANKIFQTLETHGVHVRIRIAEVIIMNGNIFDGQVPSVNSLEGFESWLSPTYNSNKYDMALLFTGADMGDAQGIANVGYVCTNRAVGVVKLIGAYFDVLVLTHEIGHLLGAAHDGTFGALGCGEKTGEIMNTYPHPASGMLPFSSCSAQSIKGKLNDLSVFGRNCMTSQNYPGHVTDPGTPDEVCRRLEGDHSSMARLYYGNYGDAICSSLACVMRVDGSRFHWKYYKAPDGMKCAKNRRCFKGQCLWTSKGDLNIPDSCPFGDQPHLGGKWQTTCDRHVRENGCFKEGWKRLCCNSCRDNIMTWG